MSRSNPGLLDPAVGQHAFHRVDNVLDRALADQRLVGAVVQVAYRGQTVYASAAGLADRESGRAMRADTVFRLASVSKPIVATAAMVLVAQERLHLDAPVQRWLPYFRPRLADGSQPEITLRQLLSHTAGLGYRFLESSEEGPYARAGVSDGMDAASISLEENLRQIAQVPLLFAPGSDWGYSLSMDVVGALLERVTGESLQQVVRSLVTDPLGMGETAFHALQPARLATAYVNDGPQPHVLGEGEVVASNPGLVGIAYSPARALNPNAFASAGAGMVGTTEDVLRLLEALRRGTVPQLPLHWVQEMGRIQSGDAGPVDAPGYGFGLGFSVLRDPTLANTPEAAGTWRWGGAYGHSWFVDVARELSVVALTNTLYEGMSGAFVGALRDAVYADIGAIQ